MTMIDNQIKEAARQYYHHLHTNPELSFNEHRTSAYIKSKLDDAGIRYESVGVTGIIGIIKGKQTTRTIGLRADMDALPLQESPAHTLKSQNDGVMHACGHDLHTACLLGTVQHLNQIKDTLPVNVLFIFQHGEEVLPGGAVDIIASPLFKAAQPEWLIALHAEPDLPVGYAGLHPGQYMASGDEIYITVKGEGGHAALPYKTVDTVLVASHIVVALQQIVSRRSNPLTPSVLTFGNIRCNSVMNIIPKEITLEGTFRTFDEKWRKEAKLLIAQMSQSITQGMGAECDVNIIEGYPSLFNNPVKTEQAIHLLQDLLGNDNVIRLEKRMTTEDFARYSQIVPATFIRLGVNNPKQNSGKLHTPEFYPDPNAIGIGIEIMSTLVINGQPSSNTIQQ